MPITSQEMRKKLDEIEIQRKHLESLIQADVTPHFADHWNAYEKAINGSHSDMSYASAKELFKKANDTLKTQVKEAQKNLVGPVGPTGLHDYDIEINNLKKAHEEFIALAEKNKKAGWIQALIALEKSSQSKSKGGTITHTGPLAPVDPTKYEQMAQDFATNKVFSNKKEGIGTIRFVPAGKDKNGDPTKESIQVEISIWPWNKKKNEKTMGTAVALAASMGKDNITINGAPENVNVAAMQTALILKGMRAKIAPKDNGKLSAVEMQWNELLEVKAGVLENQALLNDKSELTEIYSALKSLTAPQTAKPLLVQPFLSALQVEHVAEIVENLQKKDTDLLAKTPSQAATHLPAFCKDLATFITNEKHKESPIVQNFANLPSEVKTLAVFKAVEEESNEQKGLWDFRQKPRTIKPYLEKLNFAEAYQLMAKVNGLADGNYKKELKDEIHKQAVRSRQGKSVNFSTPTNTANNTNENLKAFQDLDPVEKANVYHDILDTNERAELMVALDATAPAPVAAAFVAGAIPSLAVGSKVLTEMYEGLSTPKKQELFLSKLNQDEIDRIHNEGLANDGKKQKNFLDLLKVAQPGAAPTSVAPGGAGGAAVVPLAAVPPAGATPPVPPAAAGATPPVPPAAGATPPVPPAASVPLAAVPPVAAAPLPATGFPDEVETADEAETAEAAQNLAQQSEHPAAVPPVAAAPLPATGFPDEVETADEAETAEAAQNLAQQSEHPDDRRIPTLSWMKLKQTTDDDDDIELTETQYTPTLGV